jgi:Cu-processing system permease protein
MSIGVELAPIGIVAGKEFRDRIRNRWVLAATAVLALFALAVAYFGAAQEGAVGLRGTAATIASLASLAIYLVPLVALMLGYDAIVGERDRGSLELLLSMPVTPTELLLGKYAGLALALGVSTLAGFGVAGALLVGHAGAAALYHYAGFVLSALLLGLAFLCLAVLVSALARDRVRASGVAIALWFFYVLVFDLVLLGLLVALGGKVDLGFFPVLLLASPADVFRLLNVFGTEDVRAAYGLATAVPAGFTHPVLLGGVMLLWIAAPLACAIRTFRR